MGWALSVPSLRWDQAAEVHCDQDLIEYDYAEVGALLAFRLQRLVGLHGSLQRSVSIWQKPWIFPFHVTSRCRLRCYRWCLNQETRCSWSDGSSSYINDNPTFFCSFKLAETRICSEVPQVSILGFLLLYLYKHISHMQMTHSWLSWSFTQACKRHQYQLKHVVNSFTAD